MNGLLPLILLGAGGHAKVALSLARAAGREIVGVCDPALAASGASHWRGLPVLGDDHALEHVDPATVGLVNGIGQLVGSRLRRQVHERLRLRGFHFPPLVHPHAWVDASCHLAEGAQIMAGAILQPDVSIGEGCIVNTRASVDHDCRLGPHVHVAPGATLCGAVRVDADAFIGSGATLIQGLHVGAGAVVAAGAVLVRDLPAGQLHMNKIAVRTDGAGHTERPE